jgi:hypothetical protein
MKRTLVSASHLSIQTISNLSLLFKKGEKMRTTFILITVLALATSAEAAVSLSLSSTQVDVGNTVTANVISDDTTTWMAYFVLSEDTYAWADPIAATIGDYGPRDPGPIPYGITPVPGYPGVLQLSAGGPGQPPEPGTQFWIDIIGVQPGTIYLDLQDSSYNTIAGPLTLVVVPEPMTITLLALGGLLLRRRR